MPTIPTGSRRTTVVAVAAAALVVLVAALVAGPVGNRGRSVSPTGDVSPPRPPTGPEPTATLDARGQRPSAGDFATVRARAAVTGRADVIVGLHVRFSPEGHLSPAALAAQRASIAREQARVAAAVHEAGGSVSRRYATLPYVALRLPVRAVDRLQQSGTAGSLVADDVAHLSDEGSHRQVEATETMALGRTGAGQTIAIIDSGIDRDHVFLQQRDHGPSKVVSEACYSAKEDCPGGVDHSTARGSGAPCTFAIVGCAHGTHVAGIAAGRRPGFLIGPRFSGAASGASLISVRVASRFTGSSCDGTMPHEDPCAIPVTSDVIAGLERVLSLRNSFRIAAVNLSLGSGRSPGDCDGTPWKAAIDSLRAYRIATVVSTGNSSYTWGLPSPACVSTAIAVGSSGGDAVSQFSNSDPMVDLLAPGEFIESSFPGVTPSSGDHRNYGDMSGTSQAAPHAAGAFAVLRAMSPTLPVATLLYYLRKTGKPVTDTRNDVTVPRLRLLATSVQIQDTGFTAGRALFGRGLDASSNGVGLAQRAGAPSVGVIRVDDIPSGSTVLAAYLYWMTVGGADTEVQLNGVSYNGTLLGASAGCDADLGFIARTYRASVPVAAVPGSGDYAVSDVGGSKGVDGQGASLLVVYTPPGILGHTVVYVRHGAQTSFDQARSFAFTALSMPSTPLRVELHLGVGDGETLKEQSVFFDGEVLAPFSNAFLGRDGPMWDAAQLAIPTSLLPVGTTTRTTTFGGGIPPFDCLTAAYGVLVVTLPSNPPLPD